MIDESIVHFKTACRGRKKLRPGGPPAEKPVMERIPRISRLMALAIHFDGLIRKGIVRDYADLARLGGVTRARVTQIMNLLNLAPEIQEWLLFLLGATDGREAVTEREMRRVCEVMNWKEQRGRAVPKKIPVETTAARDIMEACLTTQANLET